MDGYMLILYIGFGGLLLMAVLGLGHQWAGSHGHGGAGHHHAHSPGARHHGHLAKGSHGAKTSDRLTGILHLLFSPRLIFSLLLGFGATGVLLRPLAEHWPLFLLPVVAAIDAGVFERYIVQPFWRLLFGFASTPALTLESLVQAEGEAVTNFDAAGHGLISVDLDGQVRQLLASWPAAERQAGQRLRAGDHVLIQAVDPRRNSCTVTRLPS